MKKTVFKVLLGLVAVSAVAYLADYAALRYRVWRGLTPYGSVTVNAYYEIHEKNQKTEYVFKSSEQQTCVNSCFPHLGYAPCWYARRHTEQAIQI